MGDTAASSDRPIGQVCRCRVGRRVGDNRNCEGWGGRGTTDEPDKKMNASTFA